MLTKDTLLLGRLYKRKHVVFIREVELLVDSKIGRVRWLVAYKTATKSIVMCG